MTHEDMERAIEFILRQRAKFTGDLDQIKNFGFDVMRVQVRITNLAADLLEAQRNTGRLANLETKAAALVDAQIKTEDKVRILADQVAAGEAQGKILAEAQTKTDKKIGILADQMAALAPARDGLEPGSKFLLKRRQRAGRKKYSE